MGLEYELSHTKHRYREIFHAANDLLAERLNDLGEALHCRRCSDQEHRPDFPDALYPLHTDCAYRPWLEGAKRMIEQEVARDVLERLNGINAYKQTFSCHQCGVCCRFASSEFSYEQLQEKARHGDDFARQFTGIFLPYASIEAAQERFPALVGEVLSQIGEDRDVYFYHCPYVGEDNRCTIYGTPKRPAICADYPDTPLTFIYDRCAWKPWKDETHDDALKAHATIELCSYYLGKIAAALEI